MGGIFMSSFVYFIPALVLPLSRHFAGASYFLFLLVPYSRLVLPLSLHSVHRTSFSPPHTNALLFLPTFNVDFTFPCHFTYISVLTGPWQNSIIVVVCFV